MLLDPVMQDFLSPGHEGYMSVWRRSLCTCICTPTPVNPARDIHEAGVTTCFPPLQQQKNSTPGTRETRCRKKKGKEEITERRAAAAPLSCETLHANVCACECLKFSWTKRSNVWFVLRSSTGSLKAHVTLVPLGGCIEAIGRHNKGERVNR